MTASARTTLSPTSGLNQRVRELVAAGRDIAVLTAGEVGGGPPEHVREAAVAALRSGRYDAYGPIAGEPSLREAIAAWESRGKAGPASAEQVVVANGCKHGITLALAATAAPGSVVLVPSPNWPTYAEAVRLAGTRPVRVPSDARHGFALTGAQLEQYAQPDTTAIILGAPANPTGALPDTAQLVDIGNWCAQRGVTVLLDRIYAELCWVPVDAPPDEVLRSAGAVTVVVNGVSKSHAMTGWRVGWLLADATIAKNATAVLSHTTNHVNRIAQLGAAAALTGPQDFVEDLRARLLSNRKLVAGAFAQAPDLVRFTPPDGAFYAFPSFAPTLARTPERIPDGAALARALLEDASIAVMPGAPFGAPDHARISFTGDNAMLAAALDRLLDFLRNSASSPQSGQPAVPRP